MATPSPRRVVVVSFFVDLLDVATNLVVALLTGSAVIFAEMAQGLADSLGSALLVIGERRAVRPADAAHPLGHRREAFFWGVLSAVAMLIAGAGLSAWRGYQQLVAPEPLERSGLALAVLVLAIGTNSYAVTLSLRNLGAGEGGIRAALRRFDRPLVKSALLRDMVGTLTSVVGLIALILYQVFGLIQFDAAGALVAAVMMAMASLLLMNQARELIAGRSLPDVELERLRAALLDVPGVEALNGLAAIHAGASQVLVDLDLDVADDLDTPRIEALFDDVEARIRKARSEVTTVRINLNPHDPASRDGD